MKSKTKRSLKHFFATALGSVAVISFFQNCTQGFIPLEGESFSSLLSIGSTANSSKAASISRFEMLYAAQDLLNDPTIPLTMLADLPADSKVGGFESAGKQDYGESFVKARVAFAEKISERALKNQSVMTCRPAVQSKAAWAGCIRDIAVNFAAKAYRRPLTSAEELRLSEIYRAQSDSVAMELATLTSVRVHGSFDAVSNSGHVRGWALDPVWHQRPVEIHFYVDGPAGVGKFYGSTFAQESRPDVNAYYASEGYTGNYGFSFQLRSDLLDGKAHTLYAYPIGGGNQLIGSKSFTLTSVGSYTSIAPLLSTATAEALKATLVYVLASPAFQMRELSVDGLSPQYKTQFALANKLSWYIGSTVPDGATLELARSGVLTSPEVYRKEVRRLIAKHGKRFSFNVLGQWLGFREFQLRPQITPLETLMVQESVLVFKDILENDLPLEAIFKPGFTYANQQLAAHYGIQGPGTAQMTRLPQNERGGVLSQGSILTSSAPHGNTKPIVRGKWVQWNLLCRQIDSPTPELFQQIAEVQKEADPNWSVSETLEHHRNAGPACFHCHQYMDPLGLALENYGAGGVWRNSYSDGKPVISAGLLDGRPFQGVSELNDLLKDREDFKSCVVTKLLTHALARPLDLADIPVIKEIAAKNLTLRGVVEAIATSPAFLKSTEVKP